MYARDRQRSHLPSFRPWKSKDKDTTETGMGESELPLHNKILGINLSQALFYDV